mgnify:CR=1 FL=1
MGSRISPHLRWLANVLIGLGGGNVECKRVEDRGFRIIRIGRLHGTHLLLKGNGVRGGIFAVLAVDFGERGDVGLSRAVVFEFVAARSAAFFCARRPAAVSPAVPEGRGSATSRRPTR